MAGLQGVIEGVVAHPRKTFLYGIHGIGKTTWASSAPNPIIIQTEQGADDIGTMRFPLCIDKPDKKKYGIDMFRWCLDELLDTDHDRKTAIIDSADGLAKLLEAEVCRKQGKESIAEFGYAGSEGYDFALAEWYRTLDHIDRLADEKGMSIIVVGHSCIVDYKDPSTDNYMRNTNALHLTSKGKGIGKYIQQWADEVLFYSYKAMVRTTDKKLGKEVTKGVGGGERYLYTEYRPSHDAKNRLHLPAEMKMPLEGGYGEVYNGKDLSK